MDEQPAAAVRRKRDASINVAMRLVRDGHADAIVTAGHTGAAVASAILLLHRLPGVDRPALAVQMTTAKGPFVLLDIGATTDSTGLNLAQYATMGALYSERVLGVVRPTVALLSIGEEGGKGEQRVQEATERLRATDLAFIGNVEGRHLVEHAADVVVCDAAVGNVTIKFFEGLSSFILRGLLRAEFERDLRGRLAYLLLRPGIGRIREVFDYEKLGGSPLLGVRGTVLITHGRARRRMIEYAVAVGAAAARAEIPQAIADAFRSEASDHPLAEPAAGADGERVTSPVAVPDAGGRHGCPRGRSVSGPRLEVSASVVEATVRLAALEVPGVCRVGRGGPVWARWLAAPAISIDRRDGSVGVSVAIVARPAQPLVQLTRAVRTSIAAAVERTLELEAGPISVIVDGIGV